MTTIRTLLLLSAFFSLTQCMWHPYQPPIQQGNVIGNENVNQLHEGMTKDHVAFLLGTPLLEPPSHADHWEYVHTYQKGNSFKRTTERLTLTFKDGRLAHIERVPTS